MPTVQEHRRAFYALIEDLKRSLTLNAQALAQESSGSASSVLDRQFDHTLDRLAELYGSGTYENLSVTEIFASAIHSEAHLAHESEAESRLTAAHDDVRPRSLEGQAEEHRKRAQRLIDAARRGENVLIRSGLPYIMPYRGIYMTPFSTEVRMMLVQDRDSFVRWQDGAVAAVPEDKIAQFIAAGATVVILYLSADELHDDAANLGTVDRDAAFSSRFALAREANNFGLGEAFAHHRNRLHLHQSHILRNLRPRLQSDHPVAARALQPIVDQNRRLLEEGLRGHPSWLRSEAKNLDPLDQLVDLEHSVQEHAANWAAIARQDDSAGMLFKFQTFAEVGSLASELELVRARR